MTNPDVLIVDDDPIVRRVIEASLAELGHNVSVCNDGATAWNRIKANPPAIVVTDWNMPGLTGIELTRMIRSSRESRIYVLLVTSRSTEEDAVAAVKAGADDFLAKPIVQQELIARVQRGISALERAEREETLSKTDPLTSAYNRRVLEQDCCRLIQRARQVGEPLSCLLLDIDYFKHINDTYGHSAGDQALRRAATAIRSQLRGEDLLYRYGGDEFCVLLPRVDDSVAVERAKSIRDAIAEVELRVDDRRLRLRCSVGVGGCREDIRVPAQLLDLADEALRLAKQSGRNQIRRLGRQEDVELAPGCDTLHAISADQLMLAPPITLERKAPIWEAADQLIRLSVDSLPVIDNDGNLAGVICEQDLFQQMPHDAGWDGPIDSVMQTNFVRFRSRDSLQKIWDFFRRVAFRRVVIVDGDRPIGTISRVSLLRWATIHRHRNSLDVVGEDNQSVVRRVSELTEEISNEMATLRESLSTKPADSEMALVCAAGRLQEQAEQLLAQARYANSGVGSPTRNEHSVEFHH